MLFRSQSADGSGKPEKLATGKYILTPSSFSQDGQVLAVQITDPETARDIWMLHMNDRKMEPFLVSRFTDGAPKFSPDGKWIA